MPRTHYDPYSSDDGGDLEWMPCGTTGFAVGTPDWSKVDCKRCLAMRERLTREHIATEAEIVRQQGAMADFVAESEGKR